MIFGLLRSLAFLGLICTWFLLIRLCLVISWQSILTFVAAAVTTTMLVSGFAKFNRPFFEESVYAFILSKLVWGQRPLERFLDLVVEDGSRARSRFSLDTSSRQTWPSMRRGRAGHSLPAAQLR